jgi:hypothetical protein
MSKKGRILPPNQGLTAAILPVLRGVPTEEKPSAVAVKDSCQLFFFPQQQQQNPVHHNRTPPRLTKACV